MTRPWLIAAVILSACIAEPSTDYAEAPFLPAEEENKLAIIDAIDPPSFAVAWGTAPDDGVQVRASHVRQDAQLGLTNDLYLVRLLRTEWYRYIDEAHAIQFSTTSFVADSEIDLEIPDIDENDIIEWSLDGEAIVENLAGGQYAEIVVYGEIPGPPGTAGVLGKRRIQGNDILWPYSLHGYMHVAVGADGPMHITVRARVSATGASQNITLGPNIFLTTKRHRYVPEY